MITDIIVFGIEHSFVLGMFTGGCLFGSAFGIIGWTLGNDHAMRKVGDWIRPKNRDPEAFGDMPTLPPIRERRHITTTPGRWI